MRLAAILLSAAVLTSLAPAQTPAYVPFPNQTPEKQQAQCADIENRNVERMQQGLPAVHPWEELCNSAKIFDFTNKPNAQQLQQIVMFLRSILRMTEPQISADPEASTITLRATPGKAEMAAWLLRELDQPAFTPGPGVTRASVHELPVPRTEQDQPGKNDEVMRMFPLAHTATPQGYQEILTCVRMIGDAQIIFGDSDQFALVARAPAAQVELAAYLIKALDVEPGLRATASEFLYRAAVRPFARPVPGADTAPPDVVRVFYPAHATSPRALQQIQGTIRTVLGIQKVFQDTSSGAIPVRGTAADIAGCRVAYPGPRYSGRGRCGQPRRPRVSASRRPG